MNTKPFEPRVVKEEPATFLARIRGQSCYKSLRLIIDITAVLLAVAGAIYITLSLIVMIKFSGGEGILKFVILTVDSSNALVVLLTGLALLGGALPYRQGSVLLIDISDMLIERGRKEWNFDQPPTVGLNVSAVESVKRP